MRYFGGILALDLKWKHTNLQACYKGNLLKREICMDLT